MRHCRSSKASRTWAGATRCAGTRTSRTDSTFMHGTSIMKRLPTISVTSISPLTTPSKLPDPFFPPTGSGTSQAGLHARPFLLRSSRVRARSYRGVGIRIRSRARARSYREVDRIRSRVRAGSYREVDRIRSRVRARSYRGVDRSDRGSGPAPTGRSIETDRGPGPALTGRFDRSVGAGPGPRMVGIVGAGPGPRIRPRSREIAALRPITAVPAECLVL